jgi:L-aminoadipate-semialdehyde dehydrogenase
VDVVIHNGARVHWVLDYSTLRAANVLSTVELLNLCALNKPKKMVFVSSTAVLDTEYFLKQSNIPSTGLPESDVLVDSAKGLPTGYGQTKWVSEGLMRDAGLNGLNGVIVRPGYVTGESDRGTTITDDFLVRILKGCVQLGSYPDLGDDNYINMMPVDGVSQICVAAATNTPRGMKTFNAVSRTMSFNSYLSILQRAGFDVKKVEYDAWRSQLQQYVANSSSGKGDEHALLPLYHMAISDLPHDSRSPKLNTSNTAHVLESISASPDTLAPDEEALMRYLGYLSAIGFLPAPEGSSIPKVELAQITRDALAKVEGRGKI